MKFYKLTEADLPLIFEMNESELKVYCWLNVHLPFGDSKAIEIDTAQLAEEIGISRRSVQRALKSLESRNLFDVEITRAKVKRQTTQMSPSDTDVAQTTQMSPKRHRCRPNDTDVAQTTQMSPTQPETQIAQDFQNPKTYKTYKDFIQTLSESERERFLKFSRKTASRYNDPAIVLVEMWIARNHHWLYKEFEKIDEQEPKHSGLGQGSAPQNSDEKNDLHSLVRAGLADGRIQKLDPYFNGLGLIDARGGWWKVDEWIEKTLKGEDDADASNDSEKYRLQVKEWIEKGLRNNPDDNSASGTPIPKPEEVS